MGVPRNPEIQIPEIPPSPAFSRAPLCSAMDSPSAQTLELDCPWETRGPSVSSGSRRHPAVPPLLCSSFQQNSPGSCLYRSSSIPLPLSFNAVHQALTLPLPCHRSCPGHSPGLMGTPPPLLSLDLSPADSSPLWNPFLTWPRDHHSPMRLLQPRLSLFAASSSSPQPPSHWNIPELSPQTFSLLLSAFTS